MSDYLDALRKALEGKSDQDAWSWFCSSARLEDITSIRALLAERDALEKDAMRYRWLREEDNELPDGLGPWGCGEDLDDAIDAALSAQLEARKGDGA